MVNNEENDTYEEPKERHPRVIYKLKVSKDPTSKNMPHEKNSMTIIMNPLMKQQCKDPSFWLIKFLYIILEKFWITTLLYLLFKIVVKMKCSHITLNFKDTSLETV